MAIQQHGIVDVKIGCLCLLSYNKIYAVTKIQSDSIKQQFTENA